MKPGDEITVKVLRVDDDKQKIALGLKQLTDNPWSTVEARYEAGQVRTGRVTRVAQFGAFVELEPGIEGLIPLSETGLARDVDLKKAFPVGAERRGRHPRSGRAGRTDASQQSGGRAGEGSRRSARVHGARAIARRQRVLDRSRTNSATRSRPESRDVAVFIVMPARRPRLDWPS